MGKKSMVFFAERQRLMVHCSRFTVHSSWFTVRGSWFGTDSAGIRSIKDLNMLLKKKCLGNICYSIMI